MTPAKHRKWLFLPALFIILAAVVLISLMGKSSAARRADYARLDAEQYDTVFLSMYPVDTYREEDYAYYRAMDIVKTSYCIPNLSVLSQYMEHIRKSGNVVSTVYLGIRPERISAGRLAELVRKYPSIHFEVVLAYPSLDYWAGLSQRQLSGQLQDWKDCINALLPEANATLYFFGASEWLVANPANYLGDFLVNEQIAATLMLHSDSGHGYMLTPENAEGALDLLSRLITARRTAPDPYPDLSGWEILFFGDSIIGNYDGSDSIPGVVGGLSGATVYNCGLGGTTASQSSPEDCSLTNAVGAFLAGDLSGLPPESQLYTGLKQYQEAPSHSDRLCFVLNYGMNDFFDGAPVSSEDPLDTATYSGALRSAVCALQEAYPSARIVLCTPNFTSYFGNGREAQSEEGGILEDYAHAALAVAAEMDIEVLDNYGDLGITPDNHGEYLVDGCHPNAACRFLIGRNLAFLLS